MHYVVNLQLLGSSRESLQPIAMALDSHRAGLTSCKHARALGSSCAPASVYLMILLVPVLLPVLLLPIGCHSAMGGFASTGTGTHRFFDHVRLFSRLIFHVSNEHAFLRDRGSRQSGVGSGEWGGGSWCEHLKPGPETPAISSQVNCCISTTRL